MEHTGCDSITVNPNNIVPCITQTIRDKNSKSNVGMITGRGTRIVPPLLQYGGQSKYGDLYHANFSGWSKFLGIFL